MQPGMFSNLQDKFRKGCNHLLVAKKQDSGLPDKLIMELTEILRVLASMPDDPLVDINFERLPAGC